MRKLLVVALVLSVTSGFADDGRIDIAPPNIGDQIMGEHVAVDAAGRIVSVTNVTPPMCSIGSVTIRRFLADGTPDPSFAPVTPTLPGSYGMWSRDLDIDDRGNILVTGTLSDCSATLPTIGVVIRVTTSGRLDTTFDGPGPNCLGVGTGDGIAMFDDTPDLELSQLHVRDDGRYVVNGVFADDDLALITVDQGNGSCATSGPFDYDTEVIASSQRRFAPTQLLPRPTGGYLSIGEWVNIANNNSQGLIVPLTANGTVDFDWGPGGFMIDTSSPDPGGYVDATALGDHGFVTVHADQALGHAVLRRFDWSGQAVATFGTNGELRIASPGAAFFPNSITHVGDRLFVAAFDYGGPTTDYMIWGLDLSGNFDPTWGNNGTLRLDPGPDHADDDYFFRLATTPAGQLLATGWNSTTGDAFLRRFVAAPTTTPMTPIRVLDTRNGIGAPVAKVTNTTLSLQVAGTNGIPTSGVAAVTLNVTVDAAVAPDAGGYVTVFPCDVPLPDASNLNFRTNQIVANAVLAPLSADGRVCFHVFGSAHLIADVGGWSARWSGFTALAPSRIMSTRNGVNAVQRRVVDDNVRLNVLGKGGVPLSGVSAVSLNVTAVNTTTGVHPGYLTVYPCDAPQRPDASNLNFTANAIVPNAVIATVPADGEICFYVFGGADILVDVNGWFADGSRYTSVNPVRIMNTREGVNVARQPVDDTTVALDVDFVEFLGLGAIALNVTVTNTVAPAAGGYVTVYPCDAPRPEASTLNFRTGQTVANAVIVKVPRTGPHTGDVCFHVYGRADVIVDATGFFMP